MHTTPPVNLLNAACHANPYPYYASLREAGALGYDQEQRLWLASRASEVQEILESPHCAVRPAAEAVPKNIAGGSAGEIFSHLIRMNEGQAHTLPRKVMQTSLRNLDLSGVSQRTAFFARQLAGEHALAGGNALTQWISDLPVYVMADQLGFQAEELAQLALWMADFVRCLSPLSTSGQIDNAQSAAAALQKRFRQLLQDSHAGENSFIAKIQSEAQAEGWQQADALLANLIGLLSQTYEATTGLLGNSLIALQQHPQLLPDLKAQQEAQQNLAAWPDFVAEVARYDAPVQNTRRFVHQSCTIAGQSLQAGDVIVVLLAAANRDEHANPDAECFVLQRQARRVFTFGHGRHACPGQDIAEQIVATALQQLFSTSPAIDFATLTWAYKPSMNGRIPVFNHIKEQA
ncbi:cytochrome P450 [Undibacterium sp. TJN19]|uniref:cytochrome P450 n=1 Tax=Undibacterium sp. TJN19 TaxID=3413055 RepID=UPI003BF0A309